MWSMATKMTTKHLYPLLLTNVFCRQLKRQRHFYAKYLPNAWVEKKINFKLENYLFICHQHCRQSIESDKKNQI